MTREAKAEPKKHRHPASCDLCFTSILGARYKCLDCPDVSQSKNVTDSSGTLAKPAIPASRTFTPTTAWSKSLIPPTSS